MAENVFILGAGASFESGAPLMNIFLDVAEDLWRVNAYKDNKKIKKVFEVISKMDSVYAKSHLDLNNIESLFGAIEMARIIDKLGDYSSEEIKEAREALVTMIVKTLEKKIKYPVSDKYVNPTLSYKKFVELIEEKDKGIGDNAIITFNYDLALDFAIYKLGHNINYCLDSDSKTGRNEVRLLKLHGSINWARCGECNNIIPYSLHNYFNNYHWDTWRISTNVYFSMSEHLSDLNKTHEHDKIIDEPIIVPPTWNKSEYNGSLTNVWNQAAKDLSEARNIYVFGYSLPESDSFFRYLFALGTMGDSRIRRFWVFDPDNTGAVRTRYEKLLGRGIIKRFDYIELPFTKAIGALRKRIKV